MLKLVNIIGFVFYNEKDVLQHNIGILRVKEQFAVIGVLIYRNKMIRNLILYKINRKKENL